MPDAAFKIYLNNKPASQEQLDKFEEITVEQEELMAWEARLKMPVFTDDTGHWLGFNDDALRLFSRVRIEIKVGDEDFLPLIDGPIVRIDNDLDSEPGKSSITLVVNDDSVLLHREQKINVFKDKSDSEIAEEIFAEFAGIIAETDIDSNTPMPEDGPFHYVVQRASAMQILRKLAGRHKMQAYVLPGETTGKSIGCFKPPPEKTNGLPPLELLGENRNIISFNVNNYSSGGSNYSGSYMRVTDKGIQTESSSISAEDMYGSNAYDPQNIVEAERLLPPYVGNSVNLAQAAESDAEKSQYSLTASGSLRSQCYAGVLSPYRMITVYAGDTALSGDYIIAQVTHRITRHNYTQDFRLKYKPRGKSESSSALDAIKEIF